MRHITTTDRGGVEIVKVGDLWVGRTAVTNGQRLLFARAAGHPWTIPEDEEHDWPVTCITYKEAAAFASWCDPGARLPTESEWEAYALPIPEPVEKYAWTRDNSGGTCHPVAQREPDRYGLFDVHGGVLEWTSTMVQNEDGATEIPRVLRGGSWYGFQVNARASYRDHSHPDSRGDDVGFRVVCVSPTGPKG